ncbi:MAG: hypothetical protein EBR82_68350 [Caulobacteraceae bacterium]|nr:hypothetical protein [Caulobacteraceae bacterium]
MRDLIIAWLVWLSADPVALDVEAAKAAAAVAAARASMEVEQLPSPATPACPDGKCRVPGASPASGSSAKH